MSYSFGFTAANGKKYFLAGHKNIKDDPGFDLVEDMTPFLLRSTRALTELPPATARDRSSLISKMRLLSWLP